MVQTSSSTTGATSRNGSLSEMNPGIRSHSWNSHRYNGSTRLLPSVRWYARQEPRTPVRASVEIVESGKMGKRERRGRAAKGDRAVHLGEEGELEEDEARIEKSVTGGLEASKRRQIVAQGVSPGSLAMRCNASPAQGLRPGLLSDIPSGLKTSALRRARPVTPN